MTPLPYAPAGQIVGLLGGSFDPPHQGHVHITKAALTRFGLDRVWWLVSPGNPLKEYGPAPLAERMAAARAIMRHPRVAITDIEARIGIRYTAETLDWLTTHRPGIRFVWLMGADNLAQFHRWQHWRHIMDTVPLGVLARPGEQLAAQLSKAAQVYRHHRLPTAQAHHLGRKQAPCWSFATLPLMDQSSSAIRAAGQWR